nr:hypothetical protein [Tanacetum cinerariifolium]
IWVVFICLCLCEEGDEFRYGNLDLDNLIFWEDKILCGCCDKAEALLVTSGYEEPSAAEIGVMSGFEKIAEATTSKKHGKRWRRCTKGLIESSKRGFKLYMRNGESKDLEDMTINDLSSSLEAHEQTKLKKKQDSFDMTLQTNVTAVDVKEEKAMYVEQGRGNNFRGRGFGRARGHGRDNHDERQQRNRF